MNINIRTENEVMLWAYSTWCKKAQRESWAALPQLFKPHHHITACLRTRYTQPLTYSSRAESQASFRNSFRTEPRPALAILVRGTTSTSTSTSQTMLRYAGNYVSALLLLFSYHSNLGKFGLTSDINALLIDMKANQINRERPCSFQRRKQQGQPNKKVINWLPTSYKQQTNCSSG